MEQETITLSQLRLPLVFFACCLFWALLGFILGAVFHHAVAGLIWGLIFGVGYVVFGSWAAEKFPSDIWGAKLLENEWAPNLYEMLHELSAKMEVPLPTLYSVPFAQPNAFVVAGRDGNTAIIVTNGLTRNLEKNEVYAVAALMMARLATGAMPTWTIAATLAGLPLHLGLTLRRRSGLEWLGNFILGAFALPAAGLARLAWGEGVVTAADFHAAHLSESAEALESALYKIESAWAAEPGVAERSNCSEVNPATALLFAAPPLARADAEAAWWPRLQTRFPSVQLDAAARAARFPAKLPGFPEEPGDNS